MRSTVRGRSGHATVAVLCGLAALVLAFAQPETTDVARGFIASTIGLTAMASGVRALALVRTGESDTAIGPLLGILAGAVGTVVMGAALVSFYFAPTTTDAAATASSTQSSASSGPETERMALAQAVGTLASVIPVDSGRPDSLLVDPSGLVSTPDGTALVTVPAGAVLQYMPSPDGLQYTILLTGPTFGTTAMYDSAVGQVLVG